MGIHGASLMSRAIWDVQAKGWQRRTNHAKLLHLRNTAKDRFNCTAQCCFAMEHFADSGHELQ